MDTTKDISGNQHSRQENTISVVHKFLCCLCFRTGEKDVECDQENPQNPKGVVDDENIHIVIEDLGIDNPGFTLAEVQHCSPLQQSTLGRSSSSVSVSQRVALKKKLAPLSSLPLQSRTQEGVNEEDFIDALLPDCSSVGDDSLLTTPVINLIPPTPSDVIDDDQFFDMNSEEESPFQTSGSEGLDSIGSTVTGEQASEDEGEKPDVKYEGTCDTSEEEHPEADLQVDIMTIKGKVDKSTIHFLRSTYQVAPLPEYPRKRSLNTGVSLLQFTEHNLDDMSSKDTYSHEFLKEELRLLPLSSKINMITNQKKTAARSCSLGETAQRSFTSYPLCNGGEDICQEEESPRQRRITVASYIPQSKDHPEEGPNKQDSNRRKAKTLTELNTEGVCQWFSNIGLPKCLPFIREAELNGSHIASIDLNTLEMLQLSNLDERETLLSAIYNELHPPNSATQRLDALLERFGPHNVEKFTAALVSITKSFSSPHVNSINMNKCSFKLRQKEQNTNVKKNSQLMEITINASDRNVHLRTPKETSVGKVIESCLRMLGINEDKDHFKLKSKEDEFFPEQQIGDLPGSETRLIELHLCRKETQKDPDCADAIICTSDFIQNKNAGKIRELTQQVASLQNVILQVQGIYHGLVAFCSELKRMEGEMDAEQLDSLELRKRLSQAQKNLQSKRQSLKNLRENLNTSPMEKKKQAEMRLLEKMRLNCQVFKDEITLVHLNRQVAHLQAALEKIQSKERIERKSISLTQLVSLEAPVVLVATQMKANPDGHYAFRAYREEDRGLTVVHTEDTQLCLNDRLVEVNGVSVLESTEEELDILLTTPVAHIIILRQLSQERPQEEPSEP